MLGTHEPCSQLVNMAREHGRHFWIPVNKAHVNTCNTLVINIVHEVQKFSSGLYGARED